MSRSFVEGRPLRRVVLQSILLVLVGYFPLEVRRMLVASASTAETQQRRKEMKRSSRAYSRRQRFLMAADNCTAVRPA